MLHIKNINIKNQTILIRVDFNVPIVNNKIININKIKASIKTIKYALTQNAGIILISHLGDPVNPDPKLSLRIIIPVLEKLLKNLLKYPIIFSDNILQQLPIIIKNKQIILCENTRFIAAEKQNNIKFAKYLAGLAPIVIMDAFASAHRKHASTYEILKYAKIAAAGFLLHQEINNLENFWVKQKKPVLAIIGGAKVATKFVILKSILHKLDYLILGGVMLNTYLLSIGYNIGKSVCDLNYVEQFKKINKFNNFKSKIILPIDLIINSGCILDIGPQTIKKYIQIINHSKTILLNGPVGKYEDPRFRLGTKSLIKAVCNSKSVSIMGGGDTLAVIDQMKLKINKFSHVSTGGGAFLEFLAKRSLPMVNLLNKIFSQNN